MLSLFNRASCNHCAAAPNLGVCKALSHVSKSQMVLKLKKTSEANSSTIFLFFSFAFLFPPGIQPALSQGANLAVNAAKPALPSVIIRQRKPNSTPNTGSRRQLGFLDLFVFLMCSERRTSAGFTVAAQRCWLTLPCSS